MVDRLIRPEQVVGLLEEFFDRHLPISRYLNMRSYEFTGERFSLAIDLQPSINDKLTAFGGSLYCVCVMNGWGMVYLQGRRRGIDPNLVVSHAQIDYLTPVEDDVIVATCCEPEDANWEHFFDVLNHRGKARTKLQSTIYCQGKEAVRFSGEYAVVSPA